MATVRALSFGEILWDIIEGVPHIGGAPFNLVAHLSLLGAEVTIVSAVGTDKLGQQAIHRARDFGIDTRFVTEIPELPTGTVDVFLDENGHPDFTIHEGVAWDNLSVQPSKMQGLISIPWDVFCFGTVAQRSTAIRILLAAILEGLGHTRVFYDVNLRQSYYSGETIGRSLEASTIAKLSDEEVRIIARMLFDREVTSRSEERSFVRQVADRYGLEVVLVTRGGEGALIYHGGDFGETSCGDVKVVDTVGAGDSFSAGFLYAYLSGHDAFESSLFASRLADLVVSKPGAIPDYSAEIQRELDTI